MDLRTIQRCRADFATFRRHLLIDKADGSVATLADAADGWQTEDDLAIANGLHLAIGVPVDPKRPTYSRVLLERCRGAAKSLTLAVASGWMLWGANHRAELIWAAVDAEQGGIGRSKISRLADMNPWFGDPLDIQAGRILNRHTGSELRILASDVASSYGLTPHAVVVDELSHWGKPDLWASLVSSVAKRPNSFLGGIQNAGNSAGGTHWTWKAREAARLDDRWYFRSQPGCPMSWVSAETLAEQERLLPRQAFLRLWQNQWQHTAGDALDEADIQAAIVLDGPPDDWSIVPHTERPSTFRSPAFVGVDIGVRRDDSACVALAARNGRAELLFVQGWKPHSTLGVDLDDVRRTVLGVAKRYRAEVRYDPSQCEALAQDWRAAGINAMAFPFTPQNCTAMANAVVSQFRERKVAIWRDEELIRDLGALTIAERPNAHGYKLEARRSADGSHADRAFALAIALVPTMQAASDATNDAETARAVGQFVFDQRRYMRRSPRVY